MKPNIEGRIFLLANLKYIPLNIIVYYYRVIHESKDFTNFHFRSLTLLGSDTHLEQIEKTRQN